MSSHSTLRQVNATALLREVQAAEEDLAQVGIHNGLGCRGLARPDLRRELGIVSTLGSPISLFWWFPASLPIPGVRIRPRAALTNEAGKG